jgi:hypothetical protein
MLSLIHYVLIPRRHWLWNERAMGAMYSSKNIIKGGLPKSGWELH